MEIREIIQRIQSLYSKGVHSDDTRLRNRHIYNKLVSVNNFLLKRELENGKKISDNAYSILDCQSLVEDTITDCHCFEDPFCKVFRTKCEIPEITYLNNKPLIKSVTSIDGSVIFNYVDFEKIKYISGNKYTNKNPYFFIKNNYFYFLNINKIRVVRIVALFKNPVEVYTYNCDNKIEDCIDIYSKEFPTDEKLIEPIIELTVKELVEMFSQIQQDLTNDNIDKKE